LELEYPFIKVVHESISKVFKANKRVIEKGVHDILGLIKKPPKMESKEAYNQYVINLKKKLTVLKLKYQGLIEKEKLFWQLIQI